MKTLTSLLNNKYALFIVLFLLFTISLSCTQNQNILINKVQMQKFISITKMLQKQNTIKDSIITSQDTIILLKTNVIDNLKQTISLKDQQQQILKQQLKLQQNKVSPIWYLVGGGVAGLAIPLVTIYLYNK